MEKVEKQNEMILMRLDGRFIKWSINFIKDHSSLSKAFSRPILIGTLAHLPFSLNLGFVRLLEQG